MEKIWKELDERIIGFFCSDTCLIEQQSDTSQEAAEQPIITDSEKASLQQLIREVVPPRLRVAVSDLVHPVDA